MTASEARRKVDDGCLPLQVPLPPPLLLQPGNGLMSVLILNEKVFSQISTSVNVSASRPNENRRISSSCENDLSAIERRVTRINILLKLRRKQSQCASTVYHFKFGLKSARRLYFENPVRRRDTRRKSVLFYFFLNLYLYIVLSS